MDVDRKSFLRLKENTYKWIFAILAFASLIFLVGIIITLLKESLPVFAKIRLTSFLFGQSWYPTADPPEMGIWPLIAASFTVTVGAMVVCVPIGIGTALFIH